MGTLARELWASVAMTFALAIIVCGVYPAAVLVAAQSVFPGKANGSIVYQDGVAVGSKLLGQEFRDARYFHPRPSAAGSGYDGNASSGSNLGPTSRELVKTVNERIADYRAENSLDMGTPVPADAVSASASGLDPHISLENAMIQAVRVAGVRGWDLDRIGRLVRTHAEGRSFGLLGEPRVNVLLLNIALDREKGGR